MLRAGIRTARAVLWSTPMRIFASVLLWAVLSWAAPTRADGVPTFDVRVTSALSGLSTRSGGVGTQVGSLVRLAYFGIGARAAFSTLLFENSLGGSVDAGFVLRTRYVRFEALGRVGGARHYGIESDLEDPGVAATLPFAGAELSLSYVQKRWSRGALLIGASALMERDFGSEQVQGSEHYCGEPCLIDIGWWRFGGTLSLGMQFDLARPAP
jgi:hypothetical protein